jgi:acetyl esterase/lipase
MTRRKRGQKAKGEKSLASPLGFSISPLLAFMTSTALCLGLCSCGAVGKATLPLLLEPRVAHVERRVVYATHDGKELTADVFWPDGKGPFPVIVNIPGGAWYKENEEWLREPLCRYLCNHSFVVFNVSYSHAPEHGFPDAVNDVLGAIIFAKTSAAKYNGDPDHIGLVGDSAGANLAAMASLVWDDPYFTPTFKGDGTFTARTQANVFLFGAYDLVATYNMTTLYAVIFDNPKEATVKYLGGTPAQVPERYRLASPVNHLRKDMAPTLIVCGSNDPILPQSKAFHEKLDELGVPNALYISVGDNHGFTMYPPPFTKGAEDCYAAIAAFFWLELRPHPSRENQGIAGENAGK